MFQHTLFSLLIFWCLFHVQIFIMSHHSLFNLVKCVQGFSFLWCYCPFNILPNALFSLVVEKYMYFCPLYSAIWSETLNANFLLHLSTLFEVFDILFFPPLSDYETLGTSWTGHDFFPIDVRVKEWMIPLLFLCSLSIPWVPTLISWSLLPYLDWRAIYPLVPIIGKYSKVFRVLNPNWVIS